MTDYIDVIQKFVTVVGKWVFDRNIPFALPPTRYELYYCCSNDDEIKGMNG